MSLQSIRSCWIIAFFCVLISAAGGPARAQVNPEIANCEEIRDEATQTQVSFCTAHVGCALVMSLHKACAAAKSFLGRLKDFSFGKSEPDMNDVFEAVAQPVTDDPAYTSASQALRSAYENQPARELRSGTSQRGTSWVYQGPIAEGKMNGTGVFVNSNGVIARAEYVDGTQTGKGEFTGTPGRGVGDMQGYQLQGEAIRRYVDGARYEGQFHGGRPHGRGAMTYKSGNSYEGDFVNGKPHGQGTYTYKSGDKYVGSMADGKFNGHGTYTLAKGDVYTGPIVNGKFNGHGTYTLANGDVYTGPMVDGKFNGQGTYTFQSGNRYVGSFVNDKFNGQGTLYFRSGGQITGEFRDGKAFIAEQRNASGNVVATYSNGSETSTGTGSETAGGGAGFGEILGILGAVAGAVVEHRASRRTTSDSSPAQTSSSSPSSSSSSYSPSSSSDTPAPAPSQAARQEERPSRSGPVHNPANDATHCVSFFKDPRRESVQMKNNCSYSISVLWPGGLVNISAGGSYPSLRQSSNFRYYACRYGGMNGAGLRNYTKQGGSVICHD